MAKNFVFDEADNISVPVPADTRAGTPLRVGVLNVVTITDEGGAKQTINLGGGASLTQPSGSASGNKPGWASARLKGSANLDVTGVAAFGDPVYIKGDNTLTTTATGNKLFGAALAAKTAPKAPLHVKIINGGVAAASA